MAFGREQFDAQIHLLLACLYWQASKAASFRYEVEKS